jgi:hypothetical protein
LNQLKHFARSGKLPCGHRQVLCRFSGGLPLHEERHAKHVARVRGQLRKSRELLQRAANLARLRNLPDTAAGYLQPDAGGDALIGTCTTARGSGACPIPA